jgi:hypothetical protein
VGTGKGDANLGSNIFFMWGGLCCVSLAFAYFLVPETKGLSLEQVDKMLEESNPRTSAKWRPHTTFAAETEKRRSIAYAEEAPESHNVTPPEKTDV